MDKIVMEWIMDKLSLKCSECGSKLYSDFLDMEIDKIVYKCEKCGKRWC